MATHSSIHAWKMPWTEEPGGLQSMGSQRVGHDCTFTFNNFQSFHDVYKSNHYVAHLKGIQCYMSFISQ